MRMRLSVVRQAPGLGLIVLAAAAGVSVTSQRAIRTEESIATPKVRAARDIPAYTLLTLDDPSLYQGSERDSALNCTVTIHAVESGKRITSTSVVRPRECVNGWWQINVPGSFTTIPPGERVAILGLSANDSFPKLLDCRAILLTRTDSQAVFAVRPDAAVKVAEYLKAGKELVMLRLLDRPRAEPSTRVPVAIRRDGTPVGDSYSCSLQLTAVSTQSDSASTRVLR